MKTIADMKIQLDAVSTIKYYNDSEMIRAIVIDDEPDSVDMLCLLLTAHCPEVAVISKCLSSEQGVEKISELSPDLVFLDIEMPGLNAFELLAKLDKINFDIVFITAYNQFAIKAFKYGAIDYLLKPIDPGELKVAITKSRQRDLDLVRKLSVVLNDFKVSGNIDKKIALSTSEGLVFVPLKDILYCESNGNYTFFFVSTGEKIIVAKTLKDVEETLSGDNFFRIHHSYLINLIHVNKFLRREPGFVVMSNGAQLNVSRRKKIDFFSMFPKF